MPWYIWLLIIAVIGSVIAGLMRLRNSADEMPIDEYKLELMRNTMLKWRKQNACKATSFQFIVK